MKLVIVAIRDRAVNAFGRPNFVQAVGQAVRSFSDEVNRRAEDNQLNQHPEDFDMFELGTYDDATAQIEMLERPRQIAIGKDLIRS